MEHQSSTTATITHAASQVASAGIVASSQQRTSTSSTNATSNQQILAQKQSRAAIGSLESVVSGIVAMGTTATGTVIKMIDEIRNKWHEMTPWQRFFQVLGVAAVTAVLGYFCWKTIAGNWDTIAGAVDDIEGSCQALFKAGLENINETQAVGQVMNIFSQGIEVPQIKLDANALSAVLLPVAKVTGFSPVITSYFESLEDKIMNNMN